MTFKSLFDSKYRSLSLAKSRSRLCLQVCDSHSDMYSPMTWDARSYCSD